MEETNVQNWYTGDCPDGRRGGGAADLGRDFNPPPLSLNLHHLVPGFGEAVARCPAVAAHHLKAWDTRLFFHAFYCLKYPREVYLNLIWHWNMKYASYFSSLKIYNDAKKI